MGSDSSRSNTMMKISKSVQKPSQRLQAREWVEIKSGSKKEYSRANEKKAIKELDISRRQITEAKTMA